MLKFALQRLYRKLQKKMHRDWHRDLPFQELIFSRFERARVLGFGEGASIYHSSLVYGDVQVGKKTWVGPHTILDGTGGLTIGQYCSISAGVQIYSHDSVQWSLSGGKAAKELAPVSIGNRCYIGSQTVIAKGVTIGDGCVIGACSYVNKDIPPNTVAFGTPCVPVKEAQITERCAK